jgi:hypothetical protein
MKKLVICTMALAIAAPLLSWALLANAQQNQDKKQGKSAAKGGSAPKNEEAGLPPAYRTFATRPDLHYAAKVRFKLPTEEERVVYIVPQNKGSDLFVKGLFFYTPALALAENRNPIPGFPAVVQHAEEQPDKSTILRFKAILNSDAVTRLARGAVLKQPLARALWTKEGLQENDIQVEPWPVVHAIIALTDLWQEDDFIAVTQGEIRGGSNLEFGFRLTGPELTAVQSLAKKGRLGFVYSYSFVGKGQDYGEVDLEAVKNLKASLKNKLSSEQLDGKAPIFQAEANEAARYTALMIRKTGRSNNANVLALVSTPSLMQHLFAPGREIDLEKLEKGDEERRRQAASYLIPQIEQFREAIRAENTTRKANEKVDFDIHSTGDSFNFGAGISIYGIGINFGVGDSSEYRRGHEVKNRLETMTGTVWDVEKDTKKLLPHRISTYKFVQGSDQTLVTDRSAAYIAVDKENYYYQEKAVSIAFTDKALENGPHKDAALAGYDGVPLGTVLPFFGAKPPKGYRWCNGNAREDYPEGDNHFPDADWVPQHLRGMPLPDMREQLLGGFPKEDTDVGEMWKKGRIVVAKQTVDFSKAALDPKKPEEIPVASEGKAVLWKVWVAEAGGKEVKLDDSGAYHFEARREKIMNRDVMHHFAVKPVESKYTIYRTIAGTQELPAQTFEFNTSATNPRHLMCRWIIRVE